MSKQDKIQCVKHAAFLVKDNFYRANDYGIYSGVGVIPICKKCLYEEVEQIYIRTKDVNITIYRMCRILDMAFNRDVLNSVYDKEDEIVKTLQLYITRMNSLDGIRDGSNIFENGEHLGWNLTPEELRGKEIVQPEQNVSTADIQMQGEVIELLGYDPFLGYPPSDQKKLYYDLLGYLDNEDVVEDQYLISQIIQVVINNLQIDKINYTIGQYMENSDSMIANQLQIKGLGETKAKIASTTSSIAKENNLTVSSRGSAGSSKSSLTVLMEDLKKHGIEKIEEDYYSQGLSKGMKMSADISMKALFDQMKFDENDIREITNKQRHLISNLEKERAELEEEVRVLNVKLKEANINEQQA